jgi:phenylacetate-CoA ligase
MTLKVETACGGPDALAARIGEAIRDVTKLRGVVEFLLPGSLPNDGKVIEDARSYS